MTVEFIRDEFLEGKKEELDEIYKSLSKKPRITDRKTLFLRRFTLALMGQYRIKKYFHEKHEEIKRMNNVIEQHTNELSKPPKRMTMPPSPNISNAPAPQPRIIQKLKVPAPIKNEAKVPEPIAANIQSGKKEVTAPNPL